MNLDFAVEGSDDLVLRIQAAGQGLKQEIIDILSEASGIALDRMKMRVPRGQNPDPYHRTIHSSLRRSPVTYEPGGAGGGGEYVVHVGPEDPPEQLDFIMEGTDDLDLWHGHGNFGVMTIQKLGEPTRFRTSRKGQKPQTEWVTEAQAAANSYIAQRVARMSIFS
jgi:hypothetical protein